jgi:Protein of unknown function (DUF4242)
MPTFLDHHPMSPLSPEAQEGIAGKLRAGERDEHGVKGLNVYVAKGEAYCLSDAPDAESIVAAHRALGFEIQPDAVVEVHAVL